ncbi:MAG: nucleoside diphosphate kinase regulator [Bacteroidales bacterium]|nr:nucleoside diphosphate kinase regulator [Bacteroidales bacterium]
MKKITLSRVDHARILKSIENAKFSGTINTAEAEKLLTELSNATIVEPQEIPADVVTMNSEVKISFSKTKRSVVFKIVYPDQANIRENKISIFSPIATALIGYRVSDEIEWIVPAGLTRIRIEDILYQPEAAGDYDL